MDKFIPAQPGYFLLWLQEGTNEAHELPILFWERLGNGTFKGISIFEPPYSESTAIRLPDGRVLLDCPWHPVENGLGQSLYFDTVEEWRSWELEHPTSEG